MRLSRHVSRPVLARLAALLAATFCTACTYEVACDRPGDTVDCTVRTWFAGVPTENRQVQGVTGARLTSSRGSKGSTLYGVALTTQLGDVQVCGNSGGMDSGDDEKKFMVDEVNSYVAGKNASALRVRMREGFFAWPFVLLMVCGSGLVSFLRKRRILAGAMREQQAHPELQFEMSEQHPEVSIYCRSCGEQVPASNLDVRNKMARCGACHALFDVSAQLAGSAAPQRKRPSVPMPLNVEVKDTSAEAAKDVMPYRGLSVQPAFEIIRRWRSPEKIAELVGSLIWIAFSLYLLRAGSFSAGKLMFQVMFLTPGLIFFFRGLAGILNHTTVRAQTGRLTVGHAPVPWPGARDVTVQSLKQLFVREVPHKGKNGVRYTYELCALLQEGTPLVLLKDLPSPAQALFFEQELETRLGITDVAVEGEYAAR